MSTRILILALVISLTSCNNVKEENTAPDTTDKMEWFRDARFGMFIHWGLYAIPAGEWNEKEIAGIGEWIQCRAKVPNSEYEKLVKQFNPTEYDAEKWVLMAKYAGMKYITITTKHHDGFALYPSDVSDFDIESTPFGRDPIKELADACKKHDVKLCFYYSHRQDWRERDASVAAKEWDGHFGDQKFDSPPNPQKYYKEKAFPQVREILTKYGDIAVIWFDTPFDMTKDDSKKFVDLVHELQPNCIVNGRVGYDYGDYGGLGDNEIPISRATRDLEMCGTMNNTWGYKKNDHNWKKKEDVLNALIECASRGVNYLINIGPKADGTVPQPSVDILEYVGDWMKTNSEAIYDTEANPFPSNFPWGMVTAKNNTLYLNITNWPKNNTIELKGLMTNIKDATFLGYNDKITINKNTLQLSKPHNLIDQVIVAKIILDDKAVIDQTPRPFANGNIEIPVCTAKNSAEKGGVIAFDNGRFTKNWTPEKGSLKWDFIAPKGKYEVRVYTSRHWSTTFATGNTVSLKHNENIVVSNKELTLHTQIKNIREHSYPETISILGEIDIKESGINELSMYINKLGSFKKINSAGEFLKDDELKNIRVLKLEIVPKK